MMQKINTSDILSSLNIVDVVGQYVPIKKQGKDYFGCCPFHSEKTPSFSVVESKQMFHCFGCGASGDAITFVMEYSGLTFMEACKELGAEIELTPTKKVLQNQNRKVNKFRVPSDDKRDGDLAARVLNKSKMVNIHGLDCFESKNGFALPVYTSDFELVNCAIFAKEKHMYFIAGGISYGAFTPIRKNDSDKWIACTSLNDGKFIASSTNQNVAVCWSDHSMKYLCMWNHSDLKIRPCLTIYDDDYLAYEMKHLRLEDYKITTIERMD